MPVPVDDRVEVGGGVHLRVLRRPGTRAPFLLVHGLASNSRLWDGVAGALETAGHPSLAVDLRGHGESDRPKSGYDFDTLVSDLAHLVDGAAPVVAVGQSWGGNVVLELAVQRPDLVRAVAMVDGGFIDLSTSFATFEEAWSALEPPRFEGVAWHELEAEAALRFEGWPAEALEAQLANFLPGAGGGVGARLPRDVHRRILRHLWDHRPAARASGVAVPSLVIATRDRVEGKAQQVERLAAALAKGEVVWMDGHHDVHAQHPLVVADLLLGLLDRS